MTARPAKVQLCAECRRLGDVWRYDDDGNCLGKHDCARPAGSPEAGRDAALAATGEANPNAKRAALAIIRDAALAHDRFSSNSVRGAMVISQIPGPVVGSAFRQAARNGWIRGDGYETSTDPGTHAHPVRVWASLIWRRSAS